MVLAVIAFATSACGTARDDSRPRGTGGADDGYGGSGMLDAGAGGSAQPAPSGTGACVEPGVTAVACVVDASEGLVTGSVTATSVVVTSIEETTTESCGAPAPVRAMRVGLQVADGTALSAVVAVSGLPPDLVAPGEALEFSLDVAQNRGFFVNFDQTFVLAHGTDVVLFAAQRRTLQGLPLPLLAHYGVVLEDTNTTCLAPENACGPNHLLQVTADDATLTVTPGTAAALGDLIVSVDAASENAWCCDGKDTLRVAGFRRF